jgi:hypothetical protein
LSKAPAKNIPQDIIVEVLDDDADEFSVETRFLDQVRQNTANRNGRVPRAYRGARQYRPLALILDHVLLANGRSLLFKIVWGGSDKLPRWTYLDVEMYSAEIYYYVSGLSSAMRNHLIGKRDDIELLMLHQQIP